MLRKILPEKIKVTPAPDGAWNFDMLAEYTALLREVGLEPVRAILEQFQLTRSQGQPGNLGATLTGLIPA